MTLPNLLHVYLQMRNLIQAHSKITLVLCMKRREMGWADVCFSAEEVAAVMYLMYILKNLPR